MKKTLIIIGVIAFLIFLGVRGVKLSISRQGDERKKFVEQLGYDFSGKIDSVEGNKHFGKITFHFVHGKLDLARQAALTKELKRHDKIELLKAKGDKIEMAGTFAGKCRVGDSLYLNTSQDKIIIFRKDSLIIQSTLMNSLSTIVIGN